MVRLSLLFIAIVIGLVWAIQAPADIHRPVDQVDYVLRPSTVVMSSGQSFGSVGSYRYLHTRRVYSGTWGSRFLPRRMHGSVGNSFGSHGGLQSTGKIYYVPALIR